jgi:hypothetical protein
MSRCAIAVLKGISTASARTCRRSVGRGYSVADFASFDVLLPMPPAVSSCPSQTIVTPVMPQIMEMQILDGKHLTGTGCLLPILSPGFFMSRTNK